MNQPISKAVALQHLEAARKLNLAVKFEAELGAGSVEQIAFFINGQARNLAAIEKFMTFAVADFMDLPDETKAALDRMADDGVSSVEIELPGPNDGQQDDTVIYAKFGSTKRGDRNDG